MTKFITLFFSFICVSNSIAQIDSVLDSLNITPDQEKASKEWIDYLYQTGVEHQGDSVIFNQEAISLLTDPGYRSLIYPQIYNWEMVRSLMLKGAIKQAIWYMINLYPENEKFKETVLQSLMPLDEYIELDKVIISSYYTYVLFDPEVAIIKDGKVAEITRPDIGEQKLRDTEEIVKNVLHYRELRMKK